MGGGIKPSQGRDWEVGGGGRGTAGWLSFSEAGGWESGFPPGPEQAFLPGRKHRAALALQGLRGPAEGFSLARRGAAPERAREHTWKPV